MLVLAELKVLSCCPTRYIPGNQARAVDRRARALPNEYLAKAKGVDRVYVGTAEDDVGPVQRKLQEFGELKGLVFGAFGEASEDIHSLVQAIAEARLKAVGLRRGREGSGGELGVIVGQVRRMLSVAAVKVQAECLLRRLNSVGTGTAAARKRRQWAVWEEERWRKAQQAHMVGMQQDRNIKMFFSSSST